MNQLIAFIFLVMCVVPVWAGEGHKPRTEFIYVKDNNHDDWKYVVGGAVLTCAVISIYRQTWCFAKEPAPINFGIPTAVRLSNEN